MTIIAIHLADESDEHNKAIVAAAILDSLTHLGARVEHNCPINVLANRDPWAASAVLEGKRAILSGVKINIDY